LMLLTNGLGNTLNFSTLIPAFVFKAIIFENENLDAKDLKESYQILELEGYQLREFGRDTLAVKKYLKQFNHFFE
jgi:hypothetical protein